MVRPIIHDALFLAQKSKPADKSDAALISDLRDTLAANREGCIGMAANMIGVLKRMIIVSCEFGDMVMINPVICAKSGKYETQEGCLSLAGVRATKRFQRITVQYEDQLMRSCMGQFTGRTAQAIQHEIDHCNGVLI